MRRLYDLFGANAAHPAERMSVMAFDYLDRFRERARRFLEPNRRLLDDFLDAHPELPCFRPPAGTVCSTASRGRTGFLFHLLRAKYETSVVPGEFFEMPQYFRLGIGGPTDEVRQGLEQLGAALVEFLALTNAGPLYVPNEGKLIAIVPPNEAETALAALRRNSLGRGSRDHR